MKEKCDNMQSVPSDTEIYFVPEKGPLGFILASFVRFAVRVRTVCRVVSECDIRQRLALCYLTH